MASEKMSILFMRDSGKSRRFRIRRSLFRWVLFIFFFLCPIAAGTSIWFAYTLRAENENLLSRIEILQSMISAATATAQRLQHLEVLLAVDADGEQQISASVSASRAQNSDIHAQDPQGTRPSVKEEPGQSEDDQHPSQQEGPGHAEFPAINTGEVVVETVNSRLVAANRLRTAFDIRNPGEDTLSGVVSCILSLANGQTINLAFMPTNAGYYRIQRWKRAVLVSHIDTSYDMMNAQVIIEIHNEKKSLVYRNIFPIEQK